ncbi:MAG: SAM-dependent chlorinase/fluorinase [Chloroflexi bacterium]|nr:SAM-dependent chlorinase/fluorinase [Chloroflexota bacterium]
MTTQPIVALLTDFGLTDAYVGTMKGVLLSICPRARLVDLTHAIQPQNVRQAAYVLLTAFRHFPPHTVFLVVVDPGVGTHREASAVETESGTFVAPNNGVLSYVLPHTAVRHAVALDNPAYHLPGASQTFHGRDIFGPAAAHLANGVPITELGSTLPELVKLPDPALEIAPGHIRGEVLHIDHFGNIITSIGYLAWSGDGTLELDPQFGARQPETIWLHPEQCRLRIGDTTLDTIRPTYGAAAPGTATLLVGSSAQLEIGVNQGSAAQTLGAALGDPVMLTVES